MPQKLSIAKRDFAHDSTGFDCGNDALNRSHQAVRAAWAARQYFPNLCGPDAEKKIAGHHTLVVGSVVHGDAPERLKKGIPRHPIPVVILARLAVDNSEQGRGLGAALVTDAMRRILQAADIAGVRAMLVHAKDDSARAFYEHLGFEPFAGSPLTLYRLLKDIQLMAGKV